MDSFGYIAAAIAGALIGSGFQIYRDNKNIEKQNRDDKIQATSGLQGIKHTMLQSKASYYATFFASESLHSAAHMFAVRGIDYDGIRAKRMISGSREMENAQQYVNNKVDKDLRNSLELKEYLRLKQRSEELQLEIAKNDERFWRTIGKIRILFPNDNVEYFIENIKIADQELGELEKEIIESIYQIKNEINIRPSRIVSNVERDTWTARISTKLDEWNSTQRTTLKSRIDTFESKIDDLLNYSENALINPEYCRDCRLFCSDKRCPLSPNYILWILTNNGGQMEQRKLRRCAGLADINPILRELARKGHITISGEMVSLNQ